MEKRTVVHIEVAAKNPAASAKFYHDVFGWEIANSGPPLNYEMFKSGNVPGGFPSVDGQMYKAGDVIVYIDSDDLAADGKRIEAAGGKMLAPPMDVPGMGAFAFFSDPSGARLALWKTIPQQQE
ncbi:MAG: VOC family protein [Aggregatilineales bacterium]